MRNGSERMEQDMSEQMMTQPRAVPEEERPFWNTIARLYREYGTEEESVTDPVTVTCDVCGTKEIITDAFAGHRCAHEETTKPAVTRREAGGHPERTRYTLLGTQTPGLIEVWSVNETLLGDVQTLHTDSGLTFFVATNRHGINDRFASKRRAIAWIVR